MAKAAITQEILFDILSTYNSLTYYNPEEKVFITHLRDHLMYNLGYGRRSRKVVSIAIKSGVLFYDWSEKYLYANLSIDGDIKYHPMTPNQLAEDEAERIRQVG